MSEIIRIYDGKEFISCSVTTEDLRADNQKVQDHWGQEISSRYTSTLNHSVNVAVLCVGSARKMGLSPLMIGVIRQAALLHDIGKTKIPPEILDKPGSLSLGEKSIVQQHVKYADELLEESGVSLPIRLLACQHHERLDGTGYPHHLKGEEIHPLAQIIAVADSLDAAASRPYGNLADLIEELVTGLNPYHPQIARNVLEFFTDSLIGI